MRVFDKLHNRHFVNELRHEMNSDILLFGADGVLYYGHLQGFDDCKSVILTPAACATTSNVEIVTPGGTLVGADFVRVCMNTIVAKGTGMKGDPVLNAKHHREDAVITDDPASREYQHNYLVRQLRRLIGDRAMLTTIGGFLFQGVLSEVCNNIAMMSIDQICLPSCCQYLSEKNIRSVVLNLEAITAFGSTSSCCNCDNHSSTNDCDCHCSNGCTDN